MDSSLLQMKQYGEVLDIPTAGEVEALLREGGPGLSSGSSQHAPQDILDPDVPTAAVKSAIEAEIAENLVTLTTDAKMYSKTDSNKDNFSYFTPAPIPALLIKKLFSLGVYPLYRSPKKLSFMVSSVNNKGNNLGK